MIILNNLNLPHFFAKISFPYQQITSASALHICRINMPHNINLTLFNLNPLAFFSFDYNFASHLLK